MVANTTAISVTGHHCALVRVRNGGRATVMQNGGGDHLTDRDDPDGADRGERVHGERGADLVAARAQQHRRGAADEVAVGVVWHDCSVGADG